MVREMCEMSLCPLLTLSLYQWLLSITLSDRKYIYALQPCWGKVGLGNSGNEEQ